jgi:hypothetical protein
MPAVPLPASTPVKGRIMISHSTIRWSYWAAIFVLLVVGLAGREEALYGAVAVAVAQCVHYLVRERSFTAFPVQVRLVYVSIMIIDILWDPLRPHLYLMALSTLVLVLFDWCMLSRIMALMPWNRSEPMSWSLVRKTFFTGPVKGTIVDHMAVPA